MKVETRIDIGDVVVISDKDGRYYGEVTAVVVKKGPEIYYEVRFWDATVTLKGADVALYEKCS